MKVQSLHGDHVQDPPAFLKLLISMGPKYVPHNSPLNVLRKQLSALHTEFKQLTRVISWSAFFANCVHDTDNDNLRLGFPYSSFYPSSGKDLAPDVIDQLGHIHTAIEQSVNRQHDHCLLALERELTRPHQRTGISFKADLLRDYLRHHVLVSADKDASFVIMTVQCYQTEVSFNMATIHKTGHPVYKCLGTDEPSQQEHWQKEGLHWQNHLIQVLEQFYDKLADPMRNALVKFLHTFHDPLLAKFYLLMKTHKGLHLRPDGRWPSRPIVGLYQWATTPVSKLLCILGTILLKCDRWESPLETPLKDALDLISRVHTYMDSHSPGDIALTTYDFDALYTNLTPTDVSKACKHWRRWYLELYDPLDLLTDEEKSFARYMFSSVSSEDFLLFSAWFPFLDWQYDVTLSLAELLLLIVMKHNVFLAPGLGIYIQMIGFAMGTNCAAVWANLILRFYEKKAQCNGAQKPDCLLTRFIDDACVIHLKLDTQLLQAYLHQIYPQHLTFEILKLGQAKDVSLLDLQFISLSPLIHTVHFKPTHSCGYIPFASNTPVHYKTKYIRGECIRYLRLNNLQIGFENCCKRLKGALMRLRVPQKYWDPMPLHWHDKTRFMKQKQRTSQVVHVLRVPYHASLRMRYNWFVTNIGSSVSQYVPNLKLGTVFKPMRTLRASFQTWRTRTLTWTAEIQRDLTGISTLLEVANELDHTDGNQQ